MDPIALYRDGLDAFEDLVSGLQDDDWDRASPCTRWSVRELVNHVVYEDRWMVPLFEGQTIAQVGDRFDGDLLGDDPQGAVRSSFAAARETLAQDGIAGRKVSLSYGQEDGSEYLTQLAIDHHIHAWDLAKGAGIDDHLDAEAVATIREWFDDEREEQYVSFGAVAPALYADTDDAKTRLLAGFGRLAGWTPEVGVAHRFQDAISRGDLDTMVGLLAPDAVFESTDPPDGPRFEGRDAIRGFFEQMLAATTNPRFVIEEIIPAGENVVIRSNYSWDEPDGRRGHVRGMELVRVRDGLITDLRAYVKG